MAVASDGSGWLTQGTAIGAALTGAANQDKSLNLTSGSVVFNPGLPQLSYNGDDTFNFQEGSTRWLLRVAEASVSIAATVATRQGKAAHTLGYRSVGAAAASATNGGGGIDVGSEVHATRPFIVGADTKLYYVCTPWSAGAGSLSFTCGDTTLPAAAFPYVIDPTWTTSSQNWYCDPSPIEYTQSTGGMGQQETGYFSWEAQYSYNLPNDGQLISESVNTGGLSINVHLDPSLSASSCSQTALYAGAGRVTIDFQLSYSGDGETHGCIATVNGTASLSATANYRQRGLGHAQRRNLFRPDQNALAQWIYTHDLGGIAADRK